MIMKISNDGENNVSFSESIKNNNRRIYVDINTKEIKGSNDIYSSDLTKYEGHEFNNDNIKVFLIDDGLYKKMIGYEKATLKSLDKEILNETDFEFKNFEAINVPPTAEEIKEQENKIQKQIEEEQRVMTLEMIDMTLAELMNMQVSIIERVANLTAMVEEINQKGV